MIAILYFRMGPVTGYPPSVLADLSLTDRGIQGGMPLWSQGEAREGEAGSRRRPLVGGRIPPPRTAIPPWGTPSAAGVAGEHPWLGWVGATHPYLMKTVIIDL